MALNTQAKMLYEEKMDRNSSRLLKKKLLWLFYFAIAYHVLYVVPNFWPLFEPKYLPLTWIDQSIPFLPWTFIPYLSDYILALVVLFMVSENRLILLARLTGLVLILSSLIFVFFPTTYPRPIYPQDQNFFVQFWMNLVGAADTPNNCFPSMHVALTTICIISLNCKTRLQKALYWSWAGVICLATLTTKQHYIYDVFGGFMISWLAVTIEYHIINKRYPLSSQT